MNRAWTIMMLGLAAIMAGTSVCVVLTATGSHVTLLMVCLWQFSIVAEAVAIGFLAWVIRMTR